MALQDILKKILEEAEAEAKKIEAECEAEKKILTKESNAIQAEELKSLEGKTERALESVEEKTKSMARREGSKMVLGVKRELIEQALGSFLEHLEGAEDKTYGELVQKLFAQGKYTGKGKVLTQKARVDVTQKLAPEGFEVAADDSIGGGFILQLHGAQVDNSFRALVMEEYRPELEIYFAEQLKLV